MRIIVADTGPVNYLVALGRAGMLRELYGGVTIPPAVRVELLHPRTPEPVRRWELNAPTWFDVIVPTGEAELPTAGSGEREAIRLAKDLGAPLLCDDRQAVRAARSEGLKVTGTLGVLIEAHARGRLSIKAEIARLGDETSFHIPDATTLAEIVAEAHALRAEVLRAEALRAEARLDP